MADGTIFEERDIPAAVLVTSTFLRTADSMARRRGFPGYPYAAIPHPIGNLNADQVRQRAEEALPRVLELLGIVDAAPARSSGQQ